MTARSLQWLRRLLPGLKRRIAHRVAATCAIFGFVSIQVADFSVVRLDPLSWSVAVVVLLAKRGPVALLLALASGRVSKAVPYTVGADPPKKETAESKDWLGIGYELRTRPGLSPHTAARESWRSGPGPSAVLAVVLTLTGCVGTLVGGRTEFERHLDEGRYREAIAVFESDSALRYKEDPLFRAALLYADLDRPFSDPGRARRLLVRLLELHADTHFRAEAQAALSLLERAEETRDRLARIEKELKAAVPRAERLEKRLKEAEVRSVRLRGRLRKTKESAARLRRKLEKLRELPLGELADTAQLDGRSR